MSSATIKLFLVFGDPRRLRTAEISNWSGKAIAAPRTELDELLSRDELSQSGVYILTGLDPQTGRAKAYVGEAEVLRDRIRQHRSREFWVQAIVFVSKDENLTKSHIRYLEGRLLEEATGASRVMLDNAQSSGSRLPESDREDMEVFLSKVAQLLPVLGSEIVTPVVAGGPTADAPADRLVCEIKGLRAEGRRSSQGFVVFRGSQAVSELRPSALRGSPWVVNLREDLESQGVLVLAGECLEFAKDFEFSSPSAAAAAISGGTSNGLTIWRDSTGRTLKDLES